MTLASLAMDKALNCCFSVVDLSLCISGSILQVELPLTVYHVVRASLDRMPPALPATFISASQRAGERIQTVELSIT